MKPATPTEALELVWLTQREAALFARVSVWTIERWRHHGLAYAGGGHGSKVLIRRADLEAWLERPH